MDPAKRIIINTIAQYGKSVINTCLSLYTVRLVLSALGQSDYGIFNLIAGIIAMIGFITNALVITTQRYLSYYQGQGDSSKVKQLFSNSILLHLAIGIVLSLLLLILMDPICMDYLNISSNRRETAKFVYAISVGMLFITFISAPFKALFIAHENIVYISVIEVIDGLLKLFLVITLLKLYTDKLKIYACMMLFIVFFQFAAFSIYAIFRFKECRPRHLLSDCNIKYIKELSGFATWTTYGMGTVIARQQGLAILINKFYGTIYNASYGIATQIYGALSFIVTSIINAMTPQIMKAEGQQNRQLMLHLAEQESKYIFSTMSLLFIPLIFEMDNVLNAWLGETPPYAVFFSQCILISFLVDQLTYGLHTANQAVGNIRNYSILIYTPKGLSLVIFAALLYTGHSLESVMYSYIIVEAIVAILRIPYLNKIAGLDISLYMVHVILRLIPLVTILVIASWVQVRMWDHPYRFVISIPLTAFLGGITAWLTTFTVSERKILIGLFKKK